MLVKDNYGEVVLDDNSKWGVNTQRSLNNFKIGDEKMPHQLIQALLSTKKASAIVNGKQKVISQEVSEAIIKSCDDLLINFDASLYPLSVWQTGSGTQTNMNVNEVIAIHARNNYDVEVHPNDHVNASQSSNDVFPTAIHVMTQSMLMRDLIPELENLIKSINIKVEEYKSVYKVGRTHLQDAVPMSLAQELSAWSASLEYNLQAIKHQIIELQTIPLGGTAIGTGLNTKLGYDVEVAIALSNITNQTYVPISNKFMGLSSKNIIVNVHGALNTLATDLFKISNDVRWLASGPRCGLGEIILPSNEAGSSIMPGKVNPTQSEAMMMVCIQVFGNNATMSFANANGNFQLNVMMPLIAMNMYQTIRLLSDAMKSFEEKCVRGIEVNRTRLETNINQSLMVSTKLNPILGYDTVAKIVKEAQTYGKTIRAIILEKSLLSESELDAILDFESIVYGTK